MLTQQVASLAKTDRGPRFRLVKITSPSLSMVATTLETFRANRLRLEISNYGSGAGNIRDVFVSQRQKSRGGGVGTLYLRSCIEVHQVHN